MDSSVSQIFGGSEEECHSCESGWTMYIGSSIDDDEAENDVQDQHKGVDVESDDSMVSDASSAMTENIKNKDIYHQEAKEEDDGEQKKNSKNSTKMIVKKNGKPEKNKEKEFTSMNVAASQSGDKVRRNWLGKKK